MQMNLLPKYNVKSHIEPYEDIFVLYICARGQTDTGPLCLDSPCHPVFKAALIIVLASRKQKQIISIIYQIKLTGTDTEER